MNRQNVKQRKSVSDADYLKKLAEKLREFRAERKKATELLQKQQESQMKDEQFVRRIMRQIQRKGYPCTLLVLPTPRACEKIEIPEPQQLGQATVPGPPTGPRFLKWCASEKP
jgi:predicted transcriptional regulator